MEENKEFNVEDFYNHITKHLTPEQSLKILLKAAFISYEKLKFDKEKGEAVHPLMIIVMAAFDMGWDLAIERSDSNDEIRGISVGTEDYLKDLFKKYENEKSINNGSRRDDREQPGSLSD